MTGARRHDLRLLEATLFAASAPLDRTALGRHLPADADLDACLTELAAQYAGRGVELRRVGAGWAFRTAEDLAGALAVARVETRKLSRAAVETLAVVAYHEPVTRAEIEEIRGVGLNKGTLDILLEAGWVRPRGRRQTPGRPVLWVTTQAFLDHFGLSDRSELPGIAEMKAAGLLDSRPGLDALSARGSLDAAPGDADTDAGPPLDADFGAEVADADEPDREDGSGPG